MWKRSKVTDQTAAGQAGIKKKSKVPGVMITQFQEELPEGMTTPDFTRKPIALTIQESKVAIFKAIIVGTPTPTVTWSRANKEIVFHPDLCVQKYDETTREHTLEVASEDADTYKCFANNEHGRAVCTVLLNIISVGFSKTKELQKKEGEEATDLRKKLKKRNNDGTREQKQMEPEEKVWEILMSAEKKDYERICNEYGITDFRRMLKKLTEMKKEREEEIAEFVSHISTLKPIEVKDDDCATIELELDLKDPCSKIFLYKDGVMIPFTKEDSEALKHSLKRIGKKYVFTIKNLGSGDAGLYSVDVGGCNVFSTEFKVPEVDFVVKIKEVKAEEREDAIFQCVLTAPLNEIKWYGRSAPLTHSEKFEITVSEDKLIHKLIVRDCLQLDGGIYAAVAGIKSCNAFLVVEADKDPSNKGKKGTRKTTMAGDNNDEDLIKIAKEQQEKYQKEMEGKMELAKIAQAERESRLKKPKRQQLKEKLQLGPQPRQKRQRKWLQGELVVQGLLEPLVGRGVQELLVVLEVLGLMGAKVLVQVVTVKEEMELEPQVALKEELEVRALEKILTMKMTTIHLNILMKKWRKTEKEWREEPAEEREEERAVKRDMEQEVEREEREEKEEKEERGEGGGKGRRKKRVRDGPLVADTEIGDSNDEETTDQQGEKSGKKGKRPRKKNVDVEAEAVADPGVHFHAGLSDCKAIVGEAAELECKVSREDCVGLWYKDGDEIQSSEGITITKDGTFHRLKIHKVTEEFAGKYKFEADGRKTESLIVVEDPPRFPAEDLEAFKTPVTVKKGHRATFKLPYIGREPIKIQWYLEGEELAEEGHIKIEHSEGCSSLVLNKLQRKDSGEVKIKLKNEFGTVEAFSKLIVLDKPTPPMGPLDIVEASASVIDFKWRAPKDSGGCKIDNYILERQQIGRNTWKKVGPIGPEGAYRDSDVDHGRKYCYRIRVETEMGTSELMETEDIQAGTKAYPGPPSAPKVVSAFKDCINLSLVPPSNTGGTSIHGYNLEKRKKGSNLWGPVVPAEGIIKGKGYGVKDVVEGIEYEFRAAAINDSGAGEFSVPSEFVFARDPKKPPGKAIDFKATDSTYTTLSLSWTKPKDIEGVEDEAKGYFVEIRPAECTEWDRCNANALTMTSYTVKGLKSMAMYWVRVIATNDGGEGEPQELVNYILAMPPPVRPRFTDAKIKSFMVVRAGNSARFNINFEASPWPEVTWLKDGAPVCKKVTISNAEVTSQLLIPSAERSDTGIYTIIIKNIVGQESTSIEIRVTDEPKPPGPVETDENVPGTVTVSWTASPDEKRDDRLHYMVMKRDSSKRTWNTIADRIFNNRFTVCNIMPGREYQFRVYAKNDMGSSNPIESQKWLISAKKEKFVVNMPETKTCDLQCAPKFLVPLKMHSAPQGYECYMSCAIKGDPTPHVTWLRNNISLNTNTNYFISNTCGVCSLLILRVGPKDTGEYKIVAENSLGRAECSTKLTVREDFIAYEPTLKNQLEGGRQQTAENSSSLEKMRIKVKSMVPGVMITQHVEELPEGMTNPDFTRKPIALTIQEAIVVGTPTPTVTWMRNNGEITEERYKVVDEGAGEYQLQMPGVSSDQADTYKCCARNEYGTAFVTVTLNVIEVGFKKARAMQESRTAVRETPEDFKKALKNKVDMDAKEDKNLKSMTKKKDYESICAQYGVTDFRRMLKKLSEKKMEREEEQSKVVERLCNLKPIELKPGGGAEFELEMSLKDPTSKIFLFKDGVMVPFDLDTEIKHGLKQVGKKFVFSINGVDQDDAGLYQVEVDGIKIFSTEFKRKMLHQMYYIYTPPVDFLVKLEDVKAEEREDAMFQCVVSQPMKRITWLGKTVTLEQGEKYDILVSEDMLIHSLVVKDCLVVDKGIYAAVTGLKSCSAWLLLEADNDPATKGKKKVRKTTRAGGGGADILKIAEEQQAKIMQDREELIARARAEAAAAAEAAARAAAEKAEAEARARAEAKAKALNAGEATTDEVEEINEEGEKVEKTAEPKKEGEAPAELEEEEPTQERRKRVRTGPLVPDTVIVNKSHFHLDPGVYFTAGMSDVTAIIGTDAELVCKLSSEDCEAFWYKDGKEITASDDLCIVKDGNFRKLIIKNCKEDDAGKYRCEADGRKTEASLCVEDPPRINPDDLTEFMKPVVIKTGKEASFKLSFVGREPMKIQWYNEGEELFEESHTRIERSSTNSRLVLTKCQRKITGEIKIKIKNECGTTEAITQLVVLDRPTPPMGPVDIIESNATCIDIKWKNPKDDGGSPITDYILERQQIGRNSRKKLGKIGPEAKYRDTDVDHGRKYCYHIRAETDQGLSDLMETDDIQAGTKAYPGPPSIPKIESAFKDCINLAWYAPTNTGGTDILGYNIEKRKKGSNLWGFVHPADQPIRVLSILFVTPTGKTYACKDVVEGLEYEFRISAINISGAGEASAPSEFVFARDPKGE
ncbi:hypothetical protein F7725_017393 [Dissostichus mawsoni]|uniref:Immunoglobulin-like and fibronectin type III domain-containing protein 1 n=1 Tax=Dissostichus mawsoni TaxID=36200 RepID=A0A7J5Z4Z9_DISMA|nr:hypothetical protein F7725_017393 [Dissostichus mawsoni]